MHYLFHNTPARRDDFISLTKSSVFPLPFCGHRWIENLPVVERAIEVIVIKRYLYYSTLTKLQGAAQYDKIDVHDEIINTYMMKY